MWKKNAVSYLAWLLYTLAMGGILVGLSRVLWGQEQPLLYVGLTAGYILATGLLVFLANRFLGSIRLPGDGGRRLLVLEGLAVASLLLAGLVLRIWQLDPAMVGGRGYFQAAMVAEGSQIPQVVHGASYFYLHLLHLVFRFLGNKMVLGAWLQILLQLVGVILFYAAVRRLAGALPGLVVLAFLMCSDHWIQGILELSPEMFYLCLFSLGLVWVTAWMGRRIRMPLVFLAGAWTGLVGYLDVSGFLLGIFALFLPLAEEGEISGRGRKLAVGAVYLTGIILGFTGFLGADALCSGKGFWSVLTAWGTLYQPKGYVLPVAGGGPGVPPGILVLAGLMGLGIWSFWCGGREERMSVWILAAMGGAAASCFGLLVPRMPGYGLLYLFGCVLAGVSLGECFRRPGTVVLAAQGGEEQTGRGHVAAQVEPGVDHMPGTGHHAVTAGRDEEGLSGTAGKEKDTEGKDTEGKDAEENRSGEENAAQEKAPRVKLIENPLPLPKKHERRVMDYARQVSLEEEEYDLSVEDSDDFDIL